MENNYFLVLRGNNKDLAICEFETLWNLYFVEKISLKKVQNILYKFSSKNKIEKSHKLFSRITYTNYFGIEISTGNNLLELENQFKKTNLDKFNLESFSLRFIKSKSGIEFETSEKEFAKIIWDNLKNPKVDLENPTNEFNSIIFENQEKINLCLKLFENKKDYAKRMPKLRPVKMPYTLKSDMARASVNLLDLKEQSLILDPFCGIGGILLEACDMNFKIIGNDISYNDLKYMKKNFDFYYSNFKFDRTLADSSFRFLKENTIDGIVTDIPYGKCSRKLGKDLYENFLKSAKIYLKPNKKLVIIYANFVDFKHLALKYFNEVKQIDEYINKSMTRHILILENTK